MNSDRPTSVNVIAWFFMILGGLSILSATGYLLVYFQEPSTSFGVLPGVLQILIAGSFVVAGALFLRGSARMRQALEWGSYLLAIAIIAYGINFSSNFGSALPFAFIAIYLVPLFFVVKALRSQKVRNYASKT
ncbi:hypothetical protein A3762_03710 [Oleiphilus sp. HI0125]|uniref:hypothetical protein n=1 Tax=Oleiphilus sp. HI0125 TaxID=1822266 RepID=UPI0007C26DC4|nr:hypothetical protein [Oleiphilus sp. HI0125]KZZ60091.1 hypothetical protein A3762_03710 [Oleiphilus sp. HI0125]